MNKLLMINMCTGLSGGMKTRIHEESSESLEWLEVMAFRTRRGGVRVINDH